MLDERKIKLMAKLEMYEETEGKEDFKIGEFYRKDYVSLHLLFSFFWVTIGYICVGCLVVIVGFDFILARMSIPFLLTCAAAVLFSYLAVLIAYLGLTSAVYNNRYQNAKGRIKKYHHILIRLLRLYEKERKNG